MKDTRKPWETKTFYGAVFCGAAIVAEALGVPVHDAVYQVIFVYTGYSITDRMRVK